MSLPDYPKQGDKPENVNHGCKAVVIGCSAGGLDALRVILAGLPAKLNAAIIIVAHTTPSSDCLLSRLLATVCRLPVSEAMEREAVLPNQVYVAPPNYHLLIEPDRRFALSVDARVCFVRPSVDVLFCSAADAYRQELLGVILTGANRDGAQGLKAVKEAGGYALVQDPDSAYADIMPRAAIEICVVDRILPLDELAAEIYRYCLNPKRL